jgi:HTH-type transcriptional regulator/antitoxin HigA
MTARKQHPFTPNYASPPGATLEETMQSLGYTQKEFAVRTGLTVQTLHRIFRGKQPITSETATKLELVTGTPASFWLSLEAQYQAAQEKLSRSTIPQETVEWVAQFDYARMASLGWLPSTRKVEEKFHHLLRFFGVAGIDEWEAAHLATMKQGAYRMAPAVKQHRPDTTAWIQRGLTIARGMEPAEYDEKRFKEAVVGARTLAGQHPAQAVRTLENLYRKAGVALVFLDTLPGMGVHGFARWIKGTNSAVILHGLRFKTNDHFWFDLFHETAHILKHGRSHEFLEYDGLDDPREHEANTWAGEQLINTSAWREFVSSKRSFTAAVIHAFAAQQMVHTATVVGRLQKEKRLRPTNHSSLKLFLKDDIETLTTSPLRHRIRYELLGIGSAFIRRNRDTAPSMEAIRDSITADEYEDLRR